MAVLGAAPLFASPGLPVQLQGVGITEQVGKNVNLALEFTNEAGYQEPLSDFFKPGRPVLLDLVYYTCPMLCNLLLNGQVAALNQIPENPGTDFEIVTISINPSETFDIARAKKATYLAGYGREGAPAGWHFLTDYAGNAKRLADDVGFHYKWDARQQNFAHTAAIMFLSPTGKVCRYLYGIKFKPLDVRLAMTEASQNKFAFSVDRLLLFCYHYDPKANSYTAFATHIMSLGGALTLLLLLLFVWRMRRFERNRAAALIGVGADTRDH